SELRWHPLLREWIITATERQDRTFLPPKDYCPLDPTRPGHAPTEIPAPDFRIAVFENRFPSLRRNPPAPAVHGNDLHPTAPPPLAPPGVFRESAASPPRHEGTLTDSSLNEIQELVYVWQDRYRELGSRHEIAYVYIFENKGEAVGVTLNHPHGQIYAFPF